MFHRSWVYKLCLTYMLYLRKWWAIYDWITYVINWCFLQHGRNADPLRISFFVCVYACHRCFDTIFNGHAFTLILKYFSWFLEIWIYLVSMLFAFLIMCAVALNKIDGMILFLHWHSGKQSDWFLFCFVFFSFMKIYMDATVLHRVRFWVFFSLLLLLFVWPLYLLKVLFSWYEFISNVWYFYVSSFQYLFIESMRNMRWECADGHRRISVSWELRYTHKWTNKHNIFIYMNIKGRLLGQFSRKNKETTWTNGCHFEFRAWETIKHLNVNALSFQHYNLAPNQPYGLPKTDINLS